MVGLESPPAAIGKTLGSEAGFTGNEENQSKYDRKKRTSKKKI